MKRMNGKSKVWALALLLVVFLVGGVAGAAADRLLAGERKVSSSQRARSSDRDRRTRYLDWLAAELDLSEEQRAQVGATAERYREQVSALWTEMRPRYDALEEEMRAEIRGLLTEEQRVAYEELLARQRDRHRREMDRRQGRSDQPQGS
jgi:hypothetical protein